MHVFVDAGQPGEPKGVRQEQIRRLLQEPGPLGYRRLVNQDLLAGQRFWLVPYAELQLHNKLVLDFDASVPVLVAPLRMVEVEVRWCRVINERPALNFTAVSNGGYDTTDFVEHFLRELGGGVMDAYWKSV